MAIVISSNTQDQTELDAAVQAVDQSAKPEESVEEKKPSAEPEETKPEDAEEAPAGEVESEEGTAAEAETAEESEQEKAEEETPKAAKTKGGLEAKLDAVIRQNKILQKQISENGETAKLRKQVEESNAIIADLKAKAPQVTEPEKAPDLVKPKMPRQDDPAIDFDTEKLAAAMEQYEAEMEAYNDKKFESKWATKQAEEAEQRKKDAAEAERVQLRTELANRIDKGKASYDDFDSVTATFKEMIPDNDTVKTGADLPAVSAYLWETDTPAHLMRYFMLDMIENDGAERDRLAAMTPIKQAIAVKEIEDRLIAESKGEESETVETEEPAKPKPTTPATPQQARARTPKEPITPVRGTVKAQGDSDQDLLKRWADGDQAAGKLYQKRRDLAEAKKQPQL